MSWREEMAVEAVLVGFFRRQGVPVAMVANGAGEKFPHGIDPTIELDEHPIRLIELARELVDNFGTARPA
jgi:hypothetical protein